MEKHKQPDKPLEIPKPDKHEEVVLPIEPEGPIAIPEESPDIIPNDEPFETSPYEMPPYKEGH